jgi:chromosome segregation ATPase
MFTDIEQLEKEVQEFRKNIVGANALINSLDAIIEAIKKQTAEMASTSEKVTQKMDSQTTAIQASSEETLKKLADSLTTCVSELRGLNESAVAQLTAGNKENFEKIAEQIVATQKGYIDTLQSTERAIQECSKNLSSENKEHIESAVASIKEAQQEFVSQMQSAESALRVCKDELVAKHADFLDRLEKTNMDQIYQTCVDMRKSIAMKLTLMLAGVGLAIVIGIVGLFI